LLCSVVDFLLFKRHLW